MKKEILQSIILSNSALNESYYRLELQLPETCQGEMMPGQFVQLLAKESGAFLRRPISVCDYDSGTHRLVLLVQKVGLASSYWCTLAPGATIDLIAPLGHGFTYSPDFSGKAPLLIGGGVGVAPLLMLGKKLQQQGIKPTFLLGARTKSLLVLQDEFKNIGNLYCTTEDASFGEKGRVTDHSICATPTYSSVYTCGPLPMMKSVARWAKQHSIAKFPSKIKWLVGSGLAFAVWKIQPKGINVLVQRVLFLERKNYYGHEQYNRYNYGSWKGVSIEKPCNDRLRNVWLWYGIL